MRGCQDCIEAAKEVMKIECGECGEGIDEDDLEMCILGLDVVGLFPAMKSKNSGAILRRQSVKGPLKVRGPVHQGQQAPHRGLREGGKVPTLAEA